jgi:hypothetical protein
MASATQRHKVIRFLPTNIPVRPVMNVSGRHPTVLAGVLVDAKPGLASLLPLRRSQVFTVGF